MLQVGYVNRLIINFKRLIGPFLFSKGRTSGYGATSDVLKQASITVQPLSKCGATSDFQLCAGG